MAKRHVHIVGTGTIGEPLIGLFAEYREKLGIDEVTFSKKSALLTDRSKVKSLIKRGAKLCSEEETIPKFKEIGVNPTYTLEEALEKASVVVDCTPVGNDNKSLYYEKYADNTLGFIAQGSEFGFGKMYARGINDSALEPGKDKFIQVVSCNTHNLAVLIDTIALNNGKDREGLKSARFVCIRRANDISQDGSYIPAHQVNKHKDERFGTHHARDAHELYKTLGMDLDLFSSALKTNTQYMHTVWFHLVLKDKVTKDEVYRRLKENYRVSMTYKNSTNSVFSFGRDHGHFGRILNQTVIVQSTIEVVNDREVFGWCFTPQDGNSLYSSVAAATYFMDPDGYRNKIKCLSPYFFEEV